MALPMIKVVLFCATAQIKLPSSKIAMEVKNAVFRGKNLYPFPHVD